MFLTITVFVLEDVGVSGILVKNQYQKQDLCRSWVPKKKSDKIICAPKNRKENQTNLCVSEMFHHQNATPKNRFEYLARIKIHKL